MDDSSASRVLDREAVRTRCEEWRARGETIVFTNGCFDILHVGHARYLEQARSLGTRLVVGINSDESTSALKGPARPIVPEDERAEMVASLRAVDAVSIFGELRPDELIKVVRPHIHVKGGDYRPEDLPEAAVVRALGGEVRVLMLVPDRSTTRLLDLVRGAGKRP